MTDIHLTINPKRALRWVCGAAVAVLVLTAADCGGKFTEPFNDAPRSKVENNEAADLITMPDGFSNAATKCDHGNRVYAAYHGDAAYGSINVVAKDPTCPQPTATR